MTIQLLQTWNGKPAGIYNLAATEESRLIGLGLAREWVPRIDGTNSNKFVRAVSWEFPNGGPAFAQSAEPWYIQPATFAGNPLQDGTLGTVSAAKDRICQFAGMPDRLVVSGTTRVGGTVQWGTEHAADANYAGSAIDTVYTDGASNIESSGSAWLKFRDNVDGSQELAMGRIKKYPNGELHMLQKADDALISNCPRIQLFGAALINQQGYYRIYLSPQFGDATTPWPAYAAGKDATLIFQLKGAASQPVISVNVEYDASDSETLTVFIGTKKTNAGLATRVGQVSGLAKGVRHDIVIDTYLDWNATGYLAFWVNGALVYSETTNTLMSDYADQCLPMWGIYRYQYSTVKAPDDCKIIFHLAGVKNGMAPLA